MAITIHRLVGAGRRPAHVVTLVVDGVTHRSAVVPLFAAYGTAEDMHKALGIPYGVGKYLDADVINVDTLAELHALTQ